MTSVIWLIASAKLFPVDVSSFEDVLHVVFVEIMSLDRYCTVGLRVVVYIVICTVPFQFVAGSSKLLNCCALGFIMLLLYYIIHKVVYCVDEKYTQHCANHEYVSIESRGETMRVIHLEDNAMKHAAIQRTLNRAGVTDLTWVKNVEDGIEVIKEAMEDGNPFDLAITDMHYPLSYGEEPDWRAG